MNLTPVTPYWSRCENCGEVTYTRKQSTVSQAAAVASGLATVTRPRYAKETVPLPVRVDPRRRLGGGVLGIVAGGLFATSVPVTILLLANKLGVTPADVFLLTGSSLMATLWSFLGVGFAAMVLYAGIQVLRRKAEAGIGWIVLGAIAIFLSAVFLLFTGLTGAWVGIVAGVTLIAAGLLNVL